MLRITSLLVLTLCLAGTAEAQVQNCSLNRQGPILSGTCLGNYGIPIQTSIDMRSCPGGAVQNQSGNLVCAYGGGYGGGGYGRGYGGGGYGGPRYGY